jgi:tetratricopeptide (TPR) repeat protein
MSFRMKMYRQAEYWPALEAVSKHIAKRAPRKPDGWINYAHALKELGKIEEAKEVASKALVRHPKNASLWFNLGCYFSLLGETKEASDHIKKAVGLDKTLQQASIDHSDLDNLWKSIAK